jgi:hypothetical protein
VPLSRKHIEAFKDELNWIGSGAIVAAGFFLGAPLLIPFIWLGFEAAYMLFVPDSAWYDRRLSRKFDAEVVRRRDSLRRRFYPLLLPEDRQRFEMLERMRAEIEEQQTGSGTVQREMLRKLDFLLERFLQFGSKRAEYLEYLRELLQQETGLTPARRGWWGGREESAAGFRPSAMVGRLVQHYQAEIEGRQQELELQQGSSAAIVRKNIQILEQCRQNVAQIGEILENITQQMELVVNTFTMLNGQVRTRPPEQMLTDVQDVVGSSEALTETLAAFAPLEQAVQRLGRE